MVWSDDGYQILRASARRSAAVTYSNVLFAKVIIKVRECVHFMWSSCGSHVHKEKGGVLIGVTVANSATRQGKFAAVRAVFAQLG